MSGQSLSSKIIQYNSEASAAIIEDKDTYFEMYKEIKKIRMARTNKNGSYASTTPADVATALPPLKFANRGNICPITATTPNN